ncbi:GspH/FimT family pseudopilin [Luteimonas sp. A478]
MSGFTLIELMVTVAVLAILVTLAAPSFQELTNRNNLVSGTNEMIALLQSARLEAVRRNARVEVCPTENGSTCSGSDWARVVVRDSSGAVLRDLEINTRLTARGSSKVASKILFRPDGLAREGGAPGTVLNGVMEVCIDADRPKQNARRISISGARISTDAPVSSSSCTATVPDA